MSIQSNTCCATITLPDFGAGSHPLPIPFEVSWRLTYKIENIIIAGPIFFTSASNPVTAGSVQAAINANAVYLASNTTITVVSLNESGLTVEICKASTRKINDRPSGEFAYNSAVVNNIISEFTCNVKKSGTGGGFFYHPVIYVPISVERRIRPDSGVVERVKYETEWRIRPDSAIMHANKIYNYAGQTDTHYIYVISNAPDNLYYVNGNPVQPARGKNCHAACLSPYPKGSQYYGYYYCNKNCAGGVL